MSYGIIDLSAVQAVGDAVRSKAGTSAPIAVSELAQAVIDLPSGGGTDDDYLTIHNANKTASTINGSYLAVGGMAMYYASSLRSVYLTNCSYIGSYAFGSCKSLRTVSLPDTKKIEGYAFAYCTRLIDISIPECEYIGAAFYSCAFIGYNNCISLPMVQSIPNYTFYMCGQLSSIYIGTSNCVLGGSMAFYSTKLESGTGTIYVKSDYVDWYKSASYWSAYSSRIVGVELDDNGNPIFPT